MIIGLGIGNVPAPSAVLPRGPVLTLPHGLSGLHVQHRGIVRVEDEPELPDE